MDNMENVNDNLDQNPEMITEKKNTGDGKVNDSQNVILSYLHDLVFLLAGLLYCCFALLSFPVILC